MRLFFHAAIIIFCIGCSTGAENSNVSLGGLFKRWKDSVDASRKVCEKTLKVLRDCREVWRYHLRTAEKLPPSRNPKVYAFFKTLETMEDKLPVEAMALEYLMSVEFGESFHSSLLYELRNICSTTTVKFYKNVKGVLQNHPMWKVIFRGPEPFRQGASAYLLHQIELCLRVPSSYRMKVLPSDISQQLAYQAGLKLLEEATRIWPPSSAVLQARLAAALLLLSRKDIEKPILKILAHPRLYLAAAFLYEGASLGSFKCLVAYLSQPLPHPPVFTLPAYPELSLVPCLAQEFFSQVYLKGRSSTEVKRAFLVKKGDHLRWTAPVWVVSDRQEKNVKVEEMIKRFTSARQKAEQARYSLLKVFGTPYDWATIENWFREVLKE